MNKKIVALTIVILMSLAFAIMPAKPAFAQNQSLGVTIFQVSPANAISLNGTSTLIGTVGMELNLQGTIYYSNGSYQIIFASQVVASGTSDGYYVNTNFSVPEVPAGTYALRLKDVQLNVNSSEDDFQVTTSYTISATPSQVQEGNSVTLNVAVTGAGTGTSYSADVSVVLPSPIGTEYSKIVSLGAANQKGTASAQMAFPDSSFQPNGSVTDYVGTYNAYFNHTSNLAQTQFTVGFLDATSYHRRQTVTIRATGYAPDETATLIVTNTANSASLDSESVTASDTGVISKTWVVPSNTAIGNYTVYINPQGTSKAISDSETFAVNGYSVQIKTLNLANEVVAGVQIEALDVASNVHYDSTSGSDGVASINLETGAQSLTAFWNGVNVGQTNVTVSGGGSFNMQCQLIDLKVTVQSSGGVGIPFVTLDIAYQYHQSTGALQSGNASGETSTSGSFILENALPGISYNVNASLYNQVFNSANNTFSNIPAQAVVQLVIICPNEPLTLNVVGSNGTSIPDARIELVELQSGSFYSAATDSSGAAAAQVTFGIYRARIYKDNILINETSIEAFSPSQQEIKCSLYDIQVSVSVVDFFGNPITNANVTLNGPASEHFSAITKGSGKAAFDNVVGGSMQIIAFPSGAQNDYQAIALNINQPTSVQVKLDKYIALGPLLLQVSTMIALIVILAAIILFVIVELFWRRKTKAANENA